MELVYETDTEGVRRRSALMECAEPDCDLPVHSRGLCNKHYSAYWRKGIAPPSSSTHMHTLSHIRAGAMEATCSTCGPTRIVLKGEGGSFRCRGAVNEGKAQARKRARLKLSRPMSEGRNRGGMTIPQIRDKVRSERAGACEVCGATNNLVVDHDHTCCPPSSLCLDCVRGILCQGCNMALGALGDDPDRMLAAAEYVSRERKALA